MPSNTDPSTILAQTRVGGRYQIEASLGRGGMATVYSVWDTVAERRVALKRLTLPEDGSRHKDLLALFQGEFHALAQLAHPRVIEVYDYGVDDIGPYYTMELLDGGDLRGRSPMSWREACALLSGVCSSLALIHSRRLVHRDVSPANVWCTQDGQAKLIDFGALARMGAPAPVVGTAAFVAPEVIQQDALDGRADLFSLGATLYFALTGRAPYPARTFAQLTDLWMAPLSPPSSMIEGLPQALDALVMSLLSLDPTMRPRTAFEVMQRLTALAGIERVEPLSVSQAYLSTPVMVGRQEAMDVLHAEMDSAFGGRGRGVLIEGGSGVGRTRLLEACVLEAKMSAATILRASAATARKEEFAVAESLAEQLIGALRDPALAVAPSSPVFDKAAERLQRQKAFSEWLLRVSQLQPLLIAVDDVHEIDEPSAALPRGFSVRRREAAPSRRRHSRDRGPAERPLRRRGAGSPFQEHSAGQPHTRRDPGAPWFAVRGRSELGDGRRWCVSGVVGESAHVHGPRQALGRSWRRLLRGGCLDVAHAPRPAGLAQQRRGGDARPNRSTRSARALARRGASPGE
jgi:serine/threonine-protein kinase